MTRVNISKEGEKIKIKANGHATGSDMACNAISALVFTLEAWIVNNSFSVRKHYSSFDLGDATIEFIPVESDSYTALEFFIIGMIEIEHNYSEYMELNLDSEVYSLIGTKN